MSIIVTPVETAVNIAKDSLVSSSKQKLQNCRNDVRACVNQLVVSQFGIMLVFLLLQWMLDDKVPNWGSVARFMLLLTPITFGAYYLDLEWAPNLTIAAGVAMGNKLLTALSKSK